jgi:hypothetical protein
MNIYYTQDIRSNYLNRYLKETIDPKINSENYVILDVRITCHF